MTSSNKPAEIGTPFSEIDTPALVIDLDVMETNIRKMASYCQQHAINFRPHAKTHKSADIARLQMKHGAVGVCCQKVSEAEGLIRAGISDILVSNQVVGQRKINRLMELAEQAKIAVCVDDHHNVIELDSIAGQRRINLEVLVEIDIGNGRCGVKPGASTLELAETIRSAPHLNFSGLQAYYGTAQHIREHRLRQSAIDGAVRELRHTILQLEKHGLRSRIVTGAGTGSYPFETGSGIYTELQCGSYIFMDADYGRNCMEGGSFFNEFGQSLFVLTTVMSKTSPGHAVCDAGLKAHSVDSGLPVIVESADISYEQASDEHGLLSDPGDRLACGDKLQLIPGHCDPTVNLYDWYVGLRNGRVECLWPVTARGMIL